MLEDLFDVAPLVYGDSMDLYSSQIPLLGNTETLRSFPIRSRTPTRITSIGYIDCQFDQIVHVEHCHQQILTCLFDVQWMIRLAPTKALVDEEWVDTMVSRPQRLLQPVQSFCRVYKQDIPSPLVQNPPVYPCRSPLQHFIPKHCFYVYLVGLVIHGRSYRENRYNGHKLGHGDKGLVEIHSGNLRISLYY